MEVKQIVSLDIDQDFSPCRMLPISFLRAEEGKRDARLNGSWAGEIPRDSARFRRLPCAFHSVFAGGNPGGFQTECNKGWGFFFLCLRIISSSACLMFASAVDGVGNYGGKTNGW